MKAHLGQDRHGRRLVVREARERDARESSRLMHRLLKETPFMLRLPEEHRQFIDDEGAFITRVHEAPNWLMLLAEVDDRPVGTLLITGGGLRRVAHVSYLGMGVLQDHWGQGVGAALLDAAIAWAEANPVLRKINLQVFATNPRAIALYKSRGFAEEGLLRAEVQVDGDFIDMLQMARFV